MFGRVILFLYLQLWHWLQLPSYKCKHAVQIRHLISVLRAAVMCCCFFLPPAAVSLSLSLTHTHTHTHALTLTLSHSLSVWVGGGWGGWEGVLSLYMYIYGAGTLATAFKMLLQAVHLWPCVQPRLSALWQWGYRHVRSCVAVMVDLALVGLTWQLWTTTVGRAVLSLPFLCMYSLHPWTMLYLC